MNRTTFTPTGPHAVTLKRTGRSAYTAFARHPLTGCPRQVGRIYVTTQRYDPWAAEARVVGGVDDPPSWDARGKPKHYTGCFATKTAAHEALQAWYEEWHLKNEPSPAERRQALDAAYTVPRASAENAAVGVIDLMTETVNVLRYLADQLDSIVTSAAQSSPHALDVVAVSTQFVDTWIRRMRDVRVWNVDVNALRTMQLRLEAAQARAKLPPERAQQLDDEWIAQKMAQRLKGET